MGTEPDLAELQRKLGYTFENNELLVRALTHRSYANENQELARQDNEKLEYLGDAVLDLVVGHMLMNHHPSLREGQLSVTRAQLVSEKGLSEMATNVLDLGGYLYLGKGEDRSGGRYKPSLLANAFEALMAAVYLDRGYQAVWDLIEHLMLKVILEVEVTGFADHKTRLQERIQADLKTTPTYTVVAEHGPDHAKLFEVAVIINGREWHRSAGTSKKGAEQNVASEALWKIECTDPEWFRAEFGTPPGDD